MNAEIVRLDLLEMALSVQVNQDFFLQIRENSQRQIAFRVSNIAERTELAGFLMARYLFFGQQQRDKSKEVP